jgi:hypothetical protein
LILHLLLVGTFLILSVLVFNQASRTPIGPLFAIYMLVLFALGASIPFFVYRLYGLLRGSYTFQPGKLRLSWGLRVEEIPLVDINWISKEDGIEYRLPLPLIRWPGSYLGARRLDRRSHIEFMASQRHGLLIIETARNVYAISPEDPDAFLRAFQRATEVGYFDTVSGQSVRPGKLVESVWENRPARGLLGLATLLALAFAAWIILSVSPQPGDQFFMDNTGRLINSTQFILLPVLNSIYFVFDLLLGLFFFRREETKPLSYLLWLSSILASFLFFFAAFLLVT